MSIFYPIFGTPRSGTSLVASIVHAQGVPMGETFVQPQESGWTPDHFWADAEFNALHEKLLLNWSGPVEYGMKPANEEHWLPYVDLVIRRETLPKWGLKDVWLPLLWPEIKPLLESTVQPIFVQRSLTEIRRSYQARKGLVTEFDAEAILEPWAVAMTELRKLYPLALTVSFADIVNSPVLQTHAIAAYLDVPHKQAAVDRVRPDWKRF